MTSPHLGRDKVRRIYVLRAQGVPCKQIAADLGVCIAAVSRIARGDSYPDMTADLRERVAAAIAAALAGERASLDATADLARNRATRSPPESLPLSRVGRAAGGARPVLAESPGDTGAGRR